MRLLLDTCSMLWALQTPEKLGPKTRRALQNGENSIHVSPVSFWEISLKSSIGKLRIEGAAPEDLPAFVARAGWRVLEFHPTTAASFHGLPLVPGHKIPSIACSSGRRFGRNSSSSARTAHCRNMGDWG
jgi:PIN domain nuclease of toxin-antitoxin system